MEFKDAQTEFITVQVEFITVKWNFMAKTTRYAINYFPLWCNIVDDRRILNAEVDMGPDFLAVFPVAMKLLCWIYGKEGYYIKWEDIDSITFSKKMFSIEYTNTVRAAVKCLLSAGFFSQEKFDQHKILTSNEVQEQWLEVIRSVKGKAKVLPEYYVPPEKNVEFKDLQPEFKDLQPEFKNDEAEVLGQSKVNKSKVNNAYLQKGENGNNRYHTEEKFLPAPIVDKKSVPHIISDKPIEIAECLNLYFTHVDYEEDKYQTCVANNIILDDNEINIDLLYAWGRDFNRYLLIGNFKKKPMKGWALHFKNWLIKQPKEINPDVLNLKSNEKSNTKAPKYAGNDIAETQSFYNRPVKIKRRVPVTPKGTADAEGEI